MKSFRSALSLWLAVLAWLPLADVGGSYSGSRGAARGAEPAEGPVDAESREPAIDEPPNPFDDLILRLVHDAVPREHEDRRQWGGTTEIVSGLNVRRQGLELRTSRRRKEVPHGRWKMYRVELEDPDRDLDIQLLNPRQSDDGMLFDIEATARLQTFARYSNWRYGVRIFSISGEADARVRLKATCEIVLKLDPRNVLPDILVVPRVRDAEIRLLSLDLQRLGHLDGDLAREIGRGLRRVINELLEKRQQDLTGRMNQQLAKKQDKLRLSLHDLATSKWQSIVQPRND